MGYAYKGVCYGDLSAARYALKADFPIVTPEGVVALTGTPSVIGGDLVEMSVVRTSWLDGSTSAYSTQAKMFVCTPSGLDMYGLGTLLFILGIFFAAMAGFRAGFRP